MFGKRETTEKRRENVETSSAAARLGGVAGWLLKQFRPAPQSKPRLILLERITLTPKQSLVLIEAEGRRLLVATAPEGAPSFYALDEPARSSQGHMRRLSSHGPGRGAW